MNDVLVALAREHPTHEIQELRRKQGVAGQVRKAEGATIDRGDRLEADVEELLPEHWLRQCAGQSDRERGRVFHERLG